MQRPWGRTVPGVWEELLREERDRGRSGGQGGDGAVMWATGKNLGDFSRHLW